VESYRELPHTIPMQVTTKQGNWKRDRCVMLRLNEAVATEVATMAAEDERTVAETILRILAKSLVAGETARSANVR
jgi:hypothetical protein